MKKLLTLGVIALFTSSAFANVRVDETQLGAGADGSMQFSLAIDSTFVYKLLNDKADADAGTALQQEGQDSLIDLGQITAGIAAAGNSNDCADLVGLTQAAALGVAAQANEAETGVPVTGDTAQCSVIKTGANVDLVMAIPLEAILSKSGSGSLDIAYSRRTPVAGSFQEFQICEDLAAAAALASPLAACTAAKANVTGAIHAHADQMSVHLRARLAGSGALAAYDDYVDVEITEVP